MPMPDPMQPASSEALLLQTLSQIHENVTALRDAFDADKDARHAHEMLVDARLTAHDRLFHDMEQERREERQRKTGYITTAVGAIMAVLGGAVTALVDRFMSTPHGH